MAKGSSDKSKLVRAMVDLRAAKMRIIQLFAKLDAAQVALAALNQFVIDNPPAEPVPPAIQDPVDDVGVPDNMIEPSQ